VRTVHLRLSVPGRAADDVYDTLSDFARYPELSEAVQAVTVTDVADNATISRWEVTFRAGILRWVEEDTFDREARTIVFRQLEGDVDVFDGSWQCTATGGGTDIDFRARIDMGIPSLADALEPIAARTLIDNTVSIVNGLFGGSASVAESHIAVPAADTAPVAAGSR
jgi:ribosome-associated toxin RatA of RatAB toxin-antitoxin module